MLLEVVSKYLRFVEHAVRSLKNAYIERYQEEILTPARVNLRIRIRFVNGSLLELNEAIIVETGKIKHLNYRYHFQDQHNILVFRYDDTPHFPNLSGFPHHKHLRDQVVPAVKPSIFAVIEETQPFTE